MQLLTNPVLTFTIVLLCAALTGAALGKIITGTFRWRSSITLGLGLAIGVTATRIYELSGLIAIGAIAAIVIGVSALSGLGLFFYRKTAG